MNRQQRRNKARVDEKKNRIRAAFMKSGITPEDLKKSYKMGFDEGFRAAGMEITKCCYAALALVMFEDYGFTQEKTVEAMRKIQDKVIYTFHHSELADELLQKANITVDWGGTFQRIDTIEGVQE